MLLSTDNKKNRVNEAVSLDKRTVGYKRRKLSMTKGTQAMLELLKAAKNADIPAKYVLFDSWFSSPKSLHAVKNPGYEVIGMIKKTPKMFFRYNGEALSLIHIYKKYLCLISTVRLSKECLSLSFDATSAHTAVVFTRYMMLSIENRESRDNRSLGELFLYFTDEMSDITWIQAFQMLLQSQLVAA